MSPLFIQAKKDLLSWFLLALLVLFMFLFVTLFIFLPSYARYCLADDRLLDGVAFLDLGDGAGWELLQVRIILQTSTILPFSLGFK